MNKPRVEPDRSELPPGWRWAAWRGAEDTRAQWEVMEEKLRQAFRQRFMEIVAAIQAGRPLPKEKVFYDAGIGKAKVLRPSPGWRAWFFQDGSERCVTHFSSKSSKSGDHKAQIAIAQAARAEHMARKKAKP